MRTTTTHTGCSDERQGMVRCDRDGGDDDRVHHARLEADPVNIIKFRDVLYLVLRAGANKKTTRLLGNSNGEVGFYFTAPPNKEIHEVLTKAKFVPVEDYFYVYRP